MIELINVKKKFDLSDSYITNGVFLFVPKGKSLVIIGLSGEGKSVLLKQIIGLIPPSSGDIIIDGVNITKLSQNDLSFIYKKCGYVFQFAALLDSLDVQKNMMLPLENTSLSYEEKILLINSSLISVNLPISIQNKYPSQLSGGMKKRVGLARTLLMNPEVILYDEPTSGLDPINTRIIHELIKETQEKKKITSIIISHDKEIFNYVDLVAILYKGKIEYVGCAKNIWDCQDPFVYQFIRGLLEGPIH